MDIVRLALVVLATIASVGTPAARTPEHGRNTMEFEGQRRVYHLHLPPAYDGQTAFPLVIVLHGGGGNGPAMAYGTAFQAKADAEGFVVVFPTGQRAADGGNYWNANDATSDPVKAELTGDDVAFLAALIDHLTAELAIDEGRIYVTGFSNGAAMTHRLACALSDRIAAAAAVASALSVACDPVSPVSVLQMIGLDDPHFVDGGTIEIDGQQVDHWYAIEFWSAYNECPAEPAVEVVDRVTTETHGPCAAGTEVVRITLEGVGHRWPGNPNHPDDPLVATDVVWAFFARHARADGATPVASTAGQASLAAG
jgi:polyhydroxybutyrate depolymerase